MVARIFESAFPRWRRRNTIEIALPTLSLLLACLIIAGAVRAAETNEQTPENRDETPSTVVHTPSEGVTASSFGPQQNWNEISNNNPNYDHRQQRPYQPRYGQRQRNIHRYDHNYDNQPPQPPPPPPPHYRRNYDFENGTHQRYQRRGYRPYRRPENNANAETNDNVNSEGARRSRLELQAEAKKGKVRRFMGFVKNIFRKITGSKKKKEEDDSTHKDGDRNRDRDERDRRKDGDGTQDDGDRRHWGRGDRRFNRWGGGGSNYQRRNYRNYPDQGGYQDYRNPAGDRGFNTNYNNNRNPENNQQQQQQQQQQQGPNPNDGDRPNNRYENRRSHYRPSHYNYKQPDNPDNRPYYRQNYRQDQNTQGTVVTPSYAPQYHENSYTRSIDQTPQVK